ncbi:MAG: hypothetical protein HYR66_01175 [Sphingobacteriales bacterium]|nr:hypothetical protein [Sphingobacteriales bacterium]MBI3719752.1 hypothetical protein [Sphingobacteriales bacterium]
MLEIFKTDVTNKEQASSIICLLNQHIPHCKVNFDLHDCDKILRVTGDSIPVNTIIKLISANGITCIQLN